jgi:hypothetical protein
MAILSMLAEEMEQSMNTPYINRQVPLYDHFAFQAIPEK